jgi:selenocysteine lyase/cysteine desulfurase/short-subunit dehydrogenase
MKRIKVSKADFSKYRKSLSILDQGLFLNYAATAPLSRRSIEKIKAEAEDMKTPLGQRFYLALNNLENARRSFAELIHAKGNEIAFTQNTSMAISTIAGGLSFKPGDRILVPNNEFPSNYYPWMNLKSQGVACDKINPQKNVPIVETLKNMDLKNVRLISLSAVSYHTGRLYELQEFVEFCKNNNILTCLDSIQAIGAVKFDVQKLPVDFVCSGAQKWLMGPVGCGIIYCREEHLESLKVPYTGWTSVMYPENLDLGALEFSQEMTRFEPGLPNYLALMGMAESLLELKNIGWGNIFNAVQENTQYLQSNLKNLGFSLLTGENDQNAGITSFFVPEGIDHRSVEALYLSYKIKITARNDYVRVSPHFFNNNSELDQFLNVTEKIFKKTKLKKTSPNIESIRPSITEPKKISLQSLSPKILLTGATGHLGSEIAKQLLPLGFSLHLVDFQHDKLAALKKSLEEIIVQSEIENITLQIDVVDFLNKKMFHDWLSTLKQDNSKTFAGLIHCAGLVETALFEDLSSKKIEELLNVNVEAPLLLTHAFLKDLKSPSALGVLNVVSSTGRCGSPLLAVYSATHGAMWSLGESLAREYQDQNLTITTYVAPAMHSPMQKRMGRVSLRFFRMSGTFDYEVVEHVAAEALAVFLGKKNFYLSKMSRLKIIMNAIYPHFIDKKISKVWRRD